MIYVPLEDLAETVIWNSEVYAPHPDGKGQLPADLIAHLQRQQMPSESEPNQSYIAVRPGVISCDVLWNNRIYSPQHGETRDVPADLFGWLIENRPDLLAMDAFTIVKEKAAPPDGSRLELESPDLIAEQIAPGDMPTAPDGTVDDSGHASIGDLPDADDEEIILDVGTQIIAA